MDNNQNNPIDPASQDLGNQGATEPVAPVVPNDVNNNPASMSSEPTSATIPESALAPEAFASPAPMPAQNQMSAPAPAPAPDSTQTPSPAPVSAPFAPTMGPASAPAQPMANQNPMPAVANTQPYAAPKKSHKGLIVGIIVILVLVLGGIGAALYYTAHEKTERVIADGLVKMITAKQLTANSVVSITHDAENVYEGEMTSMKLTLNTMYNEKYEAFGNAKIEVNLKGFDSAIEAEVEGFEGENAIYFRLVDSGNISGAIAKLNSDAEESLDIKSVLESAFTAIGDSWYEIPYSELDNSGELKKTIDCVRSKRGELTEGENWNKIVDIYKNNQFISVKEDAKIESVNGYKKYPLTIDKEKSKSFSKALQKEDFYNDILACIDVAQKNRSTEIDDDEDDRIYSNNSYSGDVEILPKELEDDGESYELTLGIKPWTHEIVWIGMSIEDKASYGYNVTKMSADINLTYGSNMQTPGNTKSLNDLKNILEETVSKATKEAYYDKYCVAETKYSGYDSEAKCKEAVDEYFSEDASSAEVGNLLDSFMSVSI